MAEYYFGAGGSDLTGDGSEATPWESYDYAVSQSATGDTLYFVDGVLDGPVSPGYWNLNDARLIKGASFRNGILRANSEQSVFVARSSSSFVEANNPLVIDGIVFDGEDRVGKPFEFGSDAAEDIHIVFSNNHCKGGTLYNLFLGDQRGIQEITNVKLTGGATNMLSTTSTSAKNGNQIIDINTIEIDASNTGSGQQKGVYLERDDTLNTLDVSVKDIFGQMKTNLGSEIGIYTNGVPSILIAGSRLTIESDNIGLSSYGILASGKSVSAATDMILSGNQINFYAPAGYGISFGKSTDESYASGGRVTGNTVKGRFYTESTPHNFVIGQGTNGLIEGNTSTDGYVGYLISKTSGAAIKGNLAFDCYGPSFYIKGTVSCTVKNNIAIHTGKYDSKTVGQNGIAIISINDQGGVNTIAATIQENYVVVADVSKINALAHKNIGQTCSFVRNTYVIPDTVDIKTEKLFSHDQAIGVDPNNTLAEWSAQAEVADDKIVQLPASEISKIISRLKPVKKIIQQGVFGMSGGMCDGIFG